MSLMTPMLYICSLLFRMFVKILTEIFIFFCAFDSALKTHSLLDKGHTVLSFIQQSQCVRPDVC